MVKLPSLSEIDVIGRADDGAKASIRAPATATLFSSVTRPATETGAARAACTSSRAAPRTTPQIRLPARIQVQFYRVRRTLAPLCRRLCRDHPLQLFRGITLVMTRKL